MKNTEKLMILISVVLVSLLAIGAVSAAGADATAIGDDIEAEHTVEPTTEEPVAEPEPIEKPEVTEPTGTFQKLDDEIVAGQINHEGNVTLDKDYQNTDGHGITIKKQIDENLEEYDKLYLDGQNHIIDGNYNQTIFTIEKDMTVVMKNLIFINGQDITGGAIYNEGDLTLINVTFMSNWAEDYGGAIANYGKLTITNATFIGNGAGGEDDEDYGLGGAIYNGADEIEFLKITNATFIENTAIYGGAIYNAGFGLLVESVGFFDNFAEENGGAIYNALNYITAINNVVFDGNGADGSGGAIYTIGSFMNIEIDAIDHAWFINNFAGEQGGAIYTGATLAALNDTWFYNNTVIAPSSYQGTPAGGAIYGENLVLAIANSTFEENIATDIRNAVGIGGAIFAKSVDIEDSGFEDNFAALEGGAIEANTIDLDNVIFITNEAKYGGALFINGSDSDITDSFFAGNTAEENGGAIFSNDALNIVSTEFIANEAIKGGAIYHGKGQLTIRGSNFTENGLEDCDYSYGGALYQTKDGTSRLLRTGQQGDDVRIACKLENDIAAYGSEIYYEPSGNEEQIRINTIDIINIDGENSIKPDMTGVSIESATFYKVTSIDVDYVNTETGSVGIMVYLIDENAVNAESDFPYVFGEKVNITIMDEDGNYYVEDDPFTIGTIYYPEFLNEDNLANGTYYIYIEYKGKDGLYGSDYDDTFEVINNITTQLEEQADYYDEVIIPEIEKGYEDQIKAKNATIDDLTHQNDVLIEGNYLLNATNKNLTAENAKLATEKDDANKALAAKNAEATQLTADKTNLQNQVNTLQGQVNTLQQQNTEASAKIKKVSAKSKVKKSKKFKITVTLNNNKVNGKYVYVAFNGKMYKAKVKNGKATITIKKSALKKLGGKTVKYQVVYDQSYKNKSVKVKK